MNYKNIIMKYLPDLLILIGIYIFSFNFFRPVEIFLEFDMNDYHVNEKVLGIMLVALGLNIFIRRYLNKK